MAAVGAYTGREGCGGVAPERLPEHPRGQDQVARPRLDSLLHLRCWQIFPTSLLLRPRHSPSKCLFLGILPVTPNGSIFCREFPCKPLITKDHKGRGDGGTKLSIASMTSMSSIHCCHKNPRLVAAKSPGFSILPTTHLKSIFCEATDG